MRRRSLAAGLIVVAGAISGCGSDGGSSSEPLIEVGGYPVLGRPQMAAATYSFDGSEPAVETAATVWRFTPGAAVDRRKLDVISDALGISSAQLSVNSNGAVEWYATIGEGFFGCARIEPMPADGKLDTGNFTESTGSDMAVAPPMCDDQGTATESPSADELKATAIALFEQMGINPAEHRIVMIDDLTVSAQPLLDGIASPVVYTLGFDWEGELAYASGFLGAPERIDGFARTTAIEAIGWLQAGYYEYGWKT